MIRRTEGSMGNIREEERRKQVRIDTIGQLSANCRILSAESAGKYTFDTWHVRNVSNTGAKVYCRLDYSKDTMVFLNMDLDILRRTVGVIGKVVWSRPSGKYFSAGIVFCLWPEKIDQEAMGKFIRAKVSYEDKNIIDNSEESQSGLGI